MPCPSHSFRFYPPNNAMPPINNIKNIFVTIQKNYHK
jgi:hypothetical protein